MPVLGDASPSGEANPTLVAIGRPAMFQLVATGVSSLCSLATTVVVSRRLGYDDLSVFAIAFGIAYFVALVSRLGLDMAAVHFPARDLANNDVRGASGHVYYCLLWGLVLGSGAGLLLWLAAPYVAERLAEPAYANALRIFAVMVPAQNLIQVGGGALRGAHRGWEFVVSKVIAFHVLQLFLVLGLLYVRVDVRAAALGTLIAAWAAALVAVVFVVRAYPWARPRAETEHLLTFAGWNAVTQNVQLVMVWADLLILALYSTRAEAGLYRVASQMSQLLILVALAFDAFYVPTATRLLARGDRAHLFESTWGVARIVFYLTSCLALVLALAPDVVLLPFGPLVGGAFVPLAVLALAYAMTRLIGPAPYLLLLDGYARAEALINVVAALAAVGLGFLLVPSFGGAGAAAATAGAIMLRLLLHIVVLWRVFGVNPVPNAMWRGTAGLCVGLIAGIGAGRVWPDAAAWTSFIPVAAFAVWGFFGFLAGSDRRTMFAMLRVLERRGGRTPAEG